MSNSNQTIAITSGSITDGYVVQFSNNIASLASPTSNTPFSGIALQTTTNGQSNLIQTFGLLSPAIRTLGDGYACAVGLNSIGQPVRASDPTCVSFCNWIGYCDGYGTITVAPRIAPTINVLDFGIVPSLTYPGTSPAAFLDDVHDNMLNILQKVAENTLFYQPQNVIEYPAGYYAFKRPVGYVIPFPFDMRIRGQGTSDFESRGGFNSNNAPMPGGTTFLCYGTGLGVSFGHNNGNNERNGGIFEGIEIIGQAVGGDINVVRFNNVGTTITVSGTNNTYTRSGGSWITDGFKVGDTVYFGNFVYNQFNTESFTNFANNGRQYITGLTSTIMTVAANTQLPLVTEGPVSNVNCFANQYNDVGLEVMGDVGVLVRDVRIGGFKRSLSFDGCESSLALNIHFDGNQGTAGLGYTIADQGVDRGTGVDGYDSAFSYRVGSFYFTSGVSGNQNILQQANFNQNGWGFYCNADGTGNTIKDCTFETSVGCGIINDHIGLYIQNCTGEGASSAAIRSVGTVTQLVIENFIGSIHAPLVDLQFTVVGLTVMNCMCRNFTVPPIKGSQHAIGLRVIGCLPPYVTSGTAIAGQMCDTAGGGPRNGGLIETNLDTTSSLGISCQPLSPLDVNGNRIRIQDGYTPASSSDAFGNVGDICWDGYYIYVKTSPNGWMGTSLSSLSTLLTKDCSAGGTITFSSSELTHARYELTGSPSSSFTVIIGTGAADSWDRIVFNNSSQSVTVKATSGDTGVVVLSGKALHLLNTGTNMISVST